MKQQATRRNTWLFIGFFLLAGIANLLSRTAVPEFDTLMACVNNLIYIGLILFWIQSIHIRLLPSRARGYVTAAACLMLFFMLARIFKYNMAADVVPIRYAIYLYYVAMTLIAALFLMTCISILRGTENRSRAEYLPLVPALLLSLMILTNDAHSFFYRPKVPIGVFIADTGTYSYGPGHYLTYAWIIAAAVVGMIPLFRATRRHTAKGVAALAVMAAAWLGAVLVILLVLDKYNTFRMYNIPEVHIFSMLAIWEICIRNRLIPHNENYAGFFRNLQLPSVITDGQFRAVYRSETAPAAGESQLREALDAPVRPVPERKLSGKAIRGGYAFWEEDESAVQRAQERLIEANEMIEEENSLLRAETEQKEKDAFLQSRHRIYHEIAAEMYPCQQRIGQILGGVEPGEPGFRETIAKVSVLNAYVKRKTNLLLLASEKNELSTGELALALEESANYLTLAGLKTTVQAAEEIPAAARLVISLYDTFEALAEQLAGTTSSLMVSLNGNRLRMAAETTRLPSAGGLPLPVRILQAEDTVYLDILPGKEDEGE